MLILEGAVNESLQGSRIANNKDSDENYEIDDNR